MRRAVAIAGLSVLLVVGCARKRTVRTPGPPPPGWTEVGVASWYGHPYHGRPAASGEIYDMEQLTAAHRTLPFGTWVRVRNLRNEKTVEVRINDRGPFLDGRVIDLSRAAARRIDLIGPGTGKVRLEVIRAPAGAAGRFAVQVGAFRDRKNAERVRRDMESRYGAARLVQRSGDPALWRVLVGVEATESSAGELAGKIRREAGRHLEAFVVRLDSV